MSQTPQMKERCTEIVCMHVINVHRLKGKTLLYIFCNNSDKIIKKKRRGGGGRGT